MDGPNQLLGQCSTSTCYDKKILFAQHPIRHLTILVHKSKLDKVVVVEEYIQVVYGLS
jgi:hypothetical protein